MSTRRARAQRRSGHPARAAARQPQAKPGRRSQRAAAGATRRRPPGAGWRRSLQAGLARGWDSLAAGVARGWGSLLARLLFGRGGPAARPQAGAPARAASLTALVRADIAWAAATGLASAGLFATVLTSHPWLGDAPETVAGVSSLGILHDPGYPTYVLAAHLFTLLVPFGDEAFRVNLFSLVCASLSIAGVQLLARRLGVARWAAAVGALALATSAGYWFYSGFAKHDQFSGLVFLVSLHLLLAWRARPTTRRLLALAVAVAVGLGSSWPLEVLVLPAIAFGLIAERRRLPLPSLAGATAVGLAVVVLIAGFVMVRAAQNPPVNWGGATTVGRLIALVRRADFTSHGSHGQSAPASRGGAGGASFPGSWGAGSPPPGVLPAGAVGGNLRGDVTIFARELGVAALLLAAVGLIATVTRRRTTASYPVLLAFLGNLVGATVVVNFGSAAAGGIDHDLIDEGFVLGCYFALACWAGVGLAEVAGAAARVPLRGGRRLGEAVGRVRLIPPLAAAALAAALLLPRAVDNWPAVHRSGKPYADAYAETVLGELPHRAALFVLGAELTQPMIYRQVVYHQRPDVVVIAMDGLPQDWYRRQISRRLGIPLPPVTGNVLASVAAIIRGVARYRPVYLDARAAQSLEHVLGYRPVGLVAALSPGVGQAPVSSPTELEQRLVAAERRAGFPDHALDVWPNDFVTVAEYSTAALHAAEAYYQQRDFAGMRQALLNDLRVLPGNPPALRDLRLLGGVGGGG